VQGVEDLLERLAGEQFDVAGGQAELGIERVQQRFGEGDGGGEAVGDAAGMVSWVTLCSRSAAAMSGSAPDTDAPPPGRIVQAAATSRARTPSGPRPKTKPTASMLRPSSR